MGDLIEPTCSAGLINTAEPGTNDELFFSNPATKSGRDKMTVKRSDDSGLTWKVRQLVWSGPAAYSALVPLNSTHIGLMYENGDSKPYERISFVVLKKSLTSAADTTDSDLEKHL